MMPMTNSEIMATESTQAKQARLGQATQVSKSTSLRKSHEIVWSGNNAEIRDAARNSVVFRGTLNECQIEAQRLGLNW